MRSSQHRHSRVCYHYRHALPTFGETRLGKSPQGVRHLTFYECAEPRVGMARVPFWAGAQVNPNDTAVPASPRQPTRGYSRAGTPIDLGGQRGVPRFLSRPPIPR